MSGDIRPEIFRDDCRFIDPTNDVASLARYQKALTLLFDPAASRVELLAPPVVDEARRTISARLRSSGVLKLPWRPVIQPWESSVVWTVDSDGLITEQRQTWNISATEALRETFKIF